MAGTDSIQLIAKVVAVLPGTMFRLELENGHQLLGRVSGKIRKRFVHMREGDRVKVEVLPYDLTKGQIIMRIRNPNESRPPRRPPGPHQKSRR